METHAFTDTAGRTWDATITVDTVKRLRQLGDIDFLEIVDENAKLIERLTCDPILLVDTIYLVIKPQADDQNVTDEDFGRAMAGDAIADATMALLRSIADFFSNARERAMIHQMLDASVEAGEKAREIVARRLDEQIPKIMEQALSKFGDGLTDSLESSA